MNAAMYGLWPASPKALAGRIPGRDAEISPSNAVERRPCGGIGRHETCEGLRVLFERILCPVDGSPSSFGALRLADALASTQGASLTVLRVLPPHTLAIPGLPDDPVMAIARANFRADVVRALGEPPGAHGTMVIDIGMPAERILAHARGLSSDVIVMGTQGTTGMARMMLGSVAATVLHRAPCAVLVVPPAAAAV
jgi:universal stress protein A